MSEVERAAPGTGAPPIWEKCPGCGEINYKKLVERRLSVCPRCGHHLRLTVEQRLLITVDRGSFRERDAEVGAADPLGFRDRRSYAERLAAVRRETGRKEAVVTGTARIGGHARPPGRREPGRAGRAHRLRRAARHRADHPPEAAARLPARRVPARARHGRRDRAARRAAHHARAAARPARGPRRRAQAAARALRLRVTYEETVAY